MSTEHNPNVCAQIQMFVQLFVGTYTDQLNISIHNPFLFRRVAVAIPHFVISYYLPPPSLHKYCSAIITPTPCAATSVPIVLKNWLPWHLWLCLTGLNHSETKMCKQFCRLLSGPVQVYLNGISRPKSDPFHHRFCFCLSISA